jgi:hypothetical protein
LETIMPTKIDTDYLLRVVDALPEDLRIAVRMYNGIDQDRSNGLAIAKVLKTTRAGVQNKLAKATRLILMTIDNPDLAADDLPDLLAVARIRKLAGEATNGTPVSDEAAVPRRTNEAPQMPSDADR